MVTPTAEGVLRDALIANSRAQHIREVFAHPKTAAELVHQSRTGVLRINGCPARAEIVDQVGNGDYIVRFTVETDRRPVVV